MIMLYMPKNGLVKSKAPHHFVIVPNFNCGLAFGLSPGKSFHVMFSWHVVSMYFVKGRNLTDIDLLRQVKSLCVNIPRMEKSKLTVIWVTRGFYRFLLMLYFSNF